MIPRYIGKSTNHPHQGVSGGHGVEDTSIAEDATGEDGALESFSESLEQEEDPFSVSEADYSFGSTPAGLMTPGGAPEDTTTSQDPTSTPTTITDDTTTTTNRTSMNKTLEEHSSSSNPSLGSRKVDKSGSLDPEELSNTQGCEPETGGSKEDEASNGHDEHSNGHDEHSNGHEELSNGHQEVSNGHGELSNGQEDLGPKAITS
jgi:hypothetical protein